MYGIPESENEEGPDRYRAVTEVLATTICANSYEEQLQITRRIPFKKTKQVGSYNS